MLDGHAERLHPVEQVRRYCTHLAGFVATLADTPQSLHGVAYLHNATDHDVEDLWQLGESDWGRLFTGQRRGAFIEHLQARLAPEPGAAAADSLLGSDVKPSKQLLALAAEEVQEREQFVLLDEQQTAYAPVMRAVERSYRVNAKEIIVVSGGPGSGKSVIALSLLGELARQGRTALHATGSSAFTQTLRRAAGRRAPRVQQMFRYFNQFIDADQNGIDVLICDEAHRIRETQRLLRSLVAGLRGWRCWWLSRDGSIMAQTPTKEAIHAPPLVGIDGGDRRHYRSVAGTRPRGHSSSARRPRRRASRD